MLEVEGASVMLVSVLLARPVGQFHFIDMYHILGMATATSHMSDACDKLSSSAAACAAVCSCGLGDIQLHEDASPCTRLVKHRQIDWTWSATAQQQQRCKRPGHAPPEGLAVEHLRQSSGWRLPGPGHA